MLVAGAAVLGAMPGCGPPGLRADAAKVVTIGRPTPVTLVGHDTDGAAVTYGLSAPAPAHGALTGVPPAVVYTPAPGFLGADAFGFTVTGSGGRTASATVSVTVKRPNIVVVMDDDQNAEQQRFLNRTNTLIARQGTTFADMVVSYSECCPSRATFLTGQYAHNHGVLSSERPTGGITRFADGDTLATRLQAAGYHTSLAGKYLNGYGTDVPATYVPPGWSDWLGLVDPATYNFFDYSLSDDGTLVHRGTANEDYSTDVIFGRAEQVIRTKGGTATPLFVVVTPTAPHNADRAVATVPAPRHAGAFPTEQAPRTPAFNLADVTTMPPWIHDAPLLSATQIANMDNVYRIAAASLLAVDEGVEKLYGALRDKGELDNTLFVYTSDNGYHYGDHRMLLGKSDQYEESLRVPLLVRGPGFPAGRVATQPVANIDLAPTVAAVAGVDLGRTADGVALTRFAADPGFGARRTVVIENGPLMGRRTFVGIRDERWTYIESSTGERELYDRSTDPYETVNVYGQRWAGLGQLSAARRTAQLRACAGDPCHLGAP
jgi:N-acetylglucosamine-6-sulfatase